jgi:hypothetical protein
MIRPAAALAVAAAEYQHLPHLPAAIDADAQAVVDVLTDPGRCAYPPDRVRLLAGSDASRSEVREALADLGRNTTSEDTVVVYWTGHGGRVAGGEHAGEYLLPVDARTETPEALAQTAISGREFDEALRDISAGRVAVFFDCCHAGGIGWSKAASAPSFEPGLPTAFYEQVLASRGRAIIASSRADELSWILPGAANSLFTQHLLAGLAGGAADADGIVRIFDLFEYLQPRVTADQALQHPIFKADLEHNFPLAAVPAAARRVEAEEEPYRYDVYVSYVDAEPDSTFVWERLLPRLEREGLRVAVSGDVELPGVARVVSIERGITRARRTVVVLSPNYLTDTVADFENTLAQTMGIQENRYRLLPVQIADIDARQLPTRIGMLTRLRLDHPQRAERELQRLISALESPLETRV